MATQLEVAAVFAACTTAIDNEKNWYEVRKRWFSWGSAFFRALAAIGFIVGSLAPVLVPFLSPEWSSHSLATGYLAFVVGGIAIVVDQFFLGSKSWSRFTKAFLKLKFLRQNVDFEETSFKLTVPEDPVPLDKLLILLPKIQSLRETMQTIVTDETGVWNTEIDAAITAFKTTIDSSTNLQKTTLDAAAKAALAATAQPTLGAIELTITPPPGDQLSGVQVKIGNTAAVKVDPPFSGVVGFQGLQPGIITVKVLWTIVPKGEQFSRDAVALVEAGKITKASVSLAP